ncbi:MAG: non-ribosomal peptide synthase/polyketide synthase, partial [Longimicrobiaceae bacterium]
RTGDRARWRADGVLEFAGRTDFQVKIRGFRVEPGEVEAVLAGHPRVREAAVVVRETAPGERRLVAYATAAEGAELDPAGVRAYLAERLPEYMVPAAVVVLATLPLTAHGKVDRRALPDPEPGGAEEPVAPRTPTEEVVAGLFAGVLGVERVGAGDDFFELGGHSLLATRVISRVRETFGVELPLRALFEAPTVAGLAARVDALMRAGDGTQAPPVVRIPRDRPLPLSFAQQRLWFVEQVEPGTASYTIPVPMRLRGPVDAAVLGRALDEVVRRHEALRTVFAGVGGEPVQVVRPASRGVLAEVELGALPAEAAGREAQRLSDAENLRPFDLERGPLLRATLVRVAPEDAALLLSMHHVVSDGWSMGVLTRELSVLYGAYSRGEPSPLPELPFQYADFAAWQRGWLSGEALERQLAWWKAQLAGAPPLLELPTDRPRTATPDVRGGVRSFSLPAGTVRALRELSRREGATLFMTLLAAWQLLLSRHAGQEDVVVGSPIAGRTHLELEGLIGFFVNTLALRTDLSGDPTFAELLARVRETTLGAYAHQDVPFEKLVEELEVPRSLAHSPLFQAVLSLQNVDRMEARVGEAVVEPMGSGAVTVRFDLTLALREEGEEIRGALTYRSELWDGDTVGRMLDHLRRLLEQVAADPARRVSGLEMLGSAERTQVLEEWNATEADYPLVPVHERIAEQAARTPDAPAVVFGSETLSFAELEARASGLAGRLRAHGVGPDARVGLFLERGPDLVAGVLAILEAGGAYVALDPSYPDERLLFMLEDAGAGVVLTHSALAGRLGGFGGAVVEMDGEALVLRPPLPLAGEGGLTDVSPENLAYVIYTSGSTGTPKGVLVTHRGLSNYLAFFEREILGAEGFALPLVSRLSFDAHVRQLYPPLLRGEPVWVLPEETVGDPVAILEALGSRERVSFGGVPSLWAAVLDAIDAGERPAPRDLRAVLLGGEALPAELARRTREVFPDAAIWNHYGPTEATVNTTVARVEDPERVVLGRPIANVRVYLLDAHGSPVPTGVAGELHVGGAGVTRGYLNRPELTAEKFVPDPFTGESGARMYRSGDRVRWLPAGELEYLGRVDQQVKVRGFRIEPGEIDAALTRHPGVREAVVVVRGGVLVAYVVPAEGEALSSAAELRAWLGERLPEYMVPASFAVLERLPLTANGKVDRAALPEPGLAGEGEWYVAPRTPTEEILAGIWARYLEVERVSVDADYFALGGHSLAATSMISQVRQAFGVEVPLRAVFEAPVLSALAERIEALMREGTGMVLPPLERAPREGPLPLSFAQQRLWFIEQLDPEARLYVLAFAFRLRGEMRAGALRRSAGEVVRRHEVLRTRFLEIDGRPVQVVDPPAPVPLPVVDLRALPEDVREREARRLAEAEVRHRFDLERGPLFRVALVQLAGDDHVLLLTVHHIVFDGWSTGVFNMEVSRLYEDFAAGREPGLAEPAFQYGDYAVWQRGWLTGAILAQQLAWWKEKLTGAPPLLELPTDRPRPAAPSALAARLHFRLPEAATRGLYALGRREGSTLFMALLAAWQTLLSRYSGQEDVVVGAPIAGRRRTEVETLVGFFVNTLALRTDLSGEPTFAELLRRVRETTLGAYQYQDVPFERLVEELGVERSLSHSPVVQVTFAVQNHQRTALRLEGLRLEPFLTEADTARTDLQLTVIEGGEQLLGMLTYRTDLWEAVTVQRMLDRFMDLLHAVAADSGGSVFGLLVAPESEREHVLGEPPAAGTDGLLAHRLFAAQAARTPGAVALVCGGERLGYAELDRRANRLAGHLRALGVGPETRVGVFLERTPELVVALLGVLKAGGAYVPLDPAYPRERLRWMLEDAGARLVLTAGALAERLPERAEPLALDALRADVDARGGEEPESGVGPENLSHVIFTSGSTGRPKGVMIRHASLAVLLRWLRDNVSDEERASVLFSTSVSFDVSVAEVFGTLCWGGTLVLVENALELASVEEPVVYASMVPSAAAELLRAGGIPASVRTLNLGGEALPADLANALYALPAVEKVGNLYGPTEDTTYSTYSRVERGADRVRIGRPVAGTRAHVLDAQLRPVPDGAVGELYLAGDGLSRGYAGRPDLTAERFLPDPFGAAGSRMYRVQDRVRRSAGGELEYFGRTDFQVKVRGFRVELGEIEAALERHPGVRRAVAVVREDAPGDRRIVAYVVPAADEVPVRELRAHLREYVPEYMTPSAFVPLETLPLTGSGKVDRRALPAPEGSAAAAAYAAPRTSTEVVLAGIWAELLGVERVGVHDGFFELGGHSLLAMRLVSRVRAVLGVEVPLRVVFDAQTVAELAERIEGGAAAAPGLPPLVPAERGGPLPLSFAQQRLWFIDRLEPGSAAYNMPSALRLRGPLDARVLERALGEVVRRHEALRTTFGEAGGVPFQVVHPAGAARLEQADLSRLAAGEREAEARRLAGEEARRPFDLRAGPLVRTGLLRLGGDDHVLLPTMHHVVSDGWSMGVLFRELGALYAAFARGEPSPLPGLPVQYADFALWQRAWLGGEVLEAHVAFWKRSLAGAPPLLELPLDRPRATGQSPRAGRHHFALPRGVADGLRALSRAQGATLFMSALAGWQALLGRWAAGDDVVVGSPIDGRTQRETEGLIGFFVNMLALRAELGGDPTWRELLDRVRATALGAYAHQQLPFERLVEELGVERSLTHEPVFQVVFALQQPGADERRRLGGAEVESFGAGAGVAKYDLELTLVEVQEGLVASLAYREALWDAGTVARLAGHLESTLEAMSGDPERRLSELSLLRGGERAQVLEGWNSTAAEPPRACIHELFAEQAARTPGAVALVHDGESLTYAELEHRSERLARALRLLGVAAEVRVGLCVQRSPGMLVGILGILRAGGVYVPLDPAYPAERLAYMLDDSGAAVLLADSASHDLLPSFQGVRVRLDAPGEANPAEGEAPPAPGVSLENAAYVIYTSGSTGRPKGVVVTHGNAAHLLPRAVRTLGAAPGSRVLQAASLSFDASVLEVFVALLSGAALHVAEREVVLSPERLGALLREREIDVWVSTPALLDTLPEADFPALRTLSTGGERCPAHTAARWSRGRRLVNLYGPTETTIYTTAHACEPGVAEAPPIGRPVANSRVYVLDAWGVPVPVGVAGELHVSGAGVARGYLGRPALTAERFVPDALGGEAGGRLYRTGDRVRWRADGELEFLGRVDAQLKIRGFRIEPGEVEAALLGHPGVREAVVVAREAAVPGDRRLVGYVVAAEGGTVAPGALREHLAERLPEHMVPAAVVVLESLPLTPSGKLDRRALPEPEYAGEEERYQAPRTPEEEVAAGIWAEVLGTERVGVRDDFFDLGGHSLLATVVAARMQEVFGVEVRVGMLFETPTVAELVARIDGERRAGEGAVLPPLAPVGREGPLPLSFAQERLWFLHRMDPEGAGYNMPWSGRLRGRLDARALERALDGLVRRHEALRTTFRPVEQGAVQVVHPAAPVHLPVLDLAGLAPRAREREARRLAREEAARPFDLERGPLLRTRLLRLAGEEHVLLLTMHHVVSDGWSMGVLFHEVFTLYEAFREELASPLPPLPVQYADFAVWQRGWLRGEALRRQLDWWRERLGGAPPALELPTDRPRPAVASPRGASHVFLLPADVTRGLRALARREGATLYMAAHAALDLLLSRWSGQEDLVVGSPIAGRTQAGTEGLIGFFVNTLALRIDLSGDPPFRELVGRVRETALGAYAHQDLPFERLVEEVAPGRGLSHTPLFQVMFALQNMHTGGGGGLGGLRVEPQGSEIRTVRFDLELDLREVGEELAGSLRFRTELFDAATMERFAAQYRVVLTAAVASPEERLSRLAVLPPEEARTLLAYGSGPASGDAGGVPVHTLFAAQAARTPDAPAVLFEGESLTYAELDARAGCLARRLRGLGVGTGTAVAVCLERGPGVLVALLAVWKAGGVYLPLDPAHPAERLAFLLGDSGAELVVTEPALAASLPERGVEVVLLDRGGAEEDGAAAAEVLPGDLAYLIYTSGSTGTPKAVMVEHAQLAHTLRGALRLLGFGAGDVVAALASTAFDISLLELVTPVLAGGAVRIVPHAVARDPAALVEAAGDVSVLHAVPALMRQVVEAVRRGERLPSLRLLLVGGDAVPPDLLGEMREVFPDAAAVVLYGPTEAAIICSTHPVGGAVDGHPLGSPLPGVRLRVCGPRGELAPLGVPGELWISGGGVARGYLRRPELTGDRFVSIDGERAYRTGDRARWRPDGVLEFLGRLDEQVKVRGFRIEPAEVEAVLREQPDVREAVVLAREDRPGERRLVAYVVPRAAAELPHVAESAVEQVAAWETLFDDTYAQDEEEDDPTLRLTGWNSSYTGEPIPRGEMAEWVDRTVERILALRPERVLEIGCGTGLLLFRVAPHVAEYHGTDFSGAALEHVRGHLAGLPRVTLSEREADALAELAGAGFDTVVLNSVAQYFPGVDYLLRVLEGAAAALRPGGRIFVGDVRSLRLLGAFHVSVELARAPEELSIGRLRERVRRGMAEEQELLVDPGLFEALRERIPRLGRVEVQVKRGGHDNEVSRFRYDVVLHLDAETAGTAEPVVRRWDGEDAAGLRARIQGSASALLVRGVPDARVREHVRALERIHAADAPATAGGVRALPDAGPARGIRPDALFALGEETGRAVEVRPGAAGTLDVLFGPAGGIAAFPAEEDDGRPWEAYANDAQWGRRMRALTPALRAAVRARLPEYMLPSAFVVLEALPVTPNGKVDRAALPAPETAGAREGEYVAPRTPAEERMAGIWAEVLGIERVGGADNFFERGGHSLLATQLVSRVREAFRTELPLRTVFEAPTLAELSRRVEALRAEAAADAGIPPLVPVPRDDAPLPLSFAQQRLWFIDHLEPGSTAYHMPSALRLRGPLDARVLERALGEVARRHEALRTTFGETEGVPFQVVHPAGAARLELADLSRLPAERRDVEAGRRVREAARRPFGLRRGPLLRTHLLRLAAEEHVLVLAMHHVVSDGWSMGVLFGELSALYEAFARGESSPLPELPVQYADFAVWQRTWLAGEAMERQIAWWRERLEGAPPVLELPTDRARPAVPGPRTGRVLRALPPRTAEGVRELARREGATPYMVLLCALDLLLARWSGQKDVVVGTPIAGRTRRETEGLIGFFVNTLALRTDVSGNPAFCELLGRVREGTLGAYQHQEVPFERLVDELRVERSLSHTPLFQVMFAVNDGAGGPRPWGGLAVESYPSGGGAAKFDLDVAVAEGDGGMGVVFTYREELWDASTLERVAGAYALLLGAAAADPGRPVLGLPLVSEAERQSLVAGSSGPLRDYPAGLRVHDLFAAQAARTPHAPALVHAGGILDYAALERAANRLASHLRGLGVGPETRVGICLERGPGLVAAMLAILKAGGAYVPLDPAYPRERLAYMQEDAGVALVLTSGRLAGALPEGTPLLVLDAARAAIDAGPDVAPESGAGPENLSHVIFTSGSTGRPKGVMIRHSSTVVLLHWLREMVSDEERACALFATSVNFDVSVAEVFGTLCWGGKLVLVENALELASVREPVAYASMVPTAAAELLRAGGIPASVKTLVLGGEPLPAELARALHALGTLDRIGNAYGPTEDTTYSTFALVPRDADRVMVGRPVANTRALVLDEELQPVPGGLAGELYLAGDGLARGYAGRPELTAERFLPDPFGPAGTRMYRVGDRVRRRPDGELEYLGRTDFQVKVRGFRIELGEVEAVLGRHPGVRGVAAVVRGGSAGPDDVRIVAYLEADADVAVAGVREHARASLPEYMVPATFVVLDALPLTPNGKVDRRALPDPESAAAPADEEPRTELERAIAAVWAEVLGAPAIGVGTSFFDLGGNSLLVVRAARLLEAALGRSVRVLDFFEHVTVADLARHLSGAAENPVENLREGNDGPGRLRRAIPVRPAGSEPPLFLVHDGWGSVAYAQALHPHFGEELPVYALPPVSGDEPPLHTVEAMAARLVRMVREVQPVGPYRLAGWSFGGILAYEMAAQLVGQDQAVEFLGMIDTYHPSAVRTGPEDRASAAWEADPGALAAPRRETGLLPGHLTPDEVREVHDRLRTSLLSLRGYSPRPVPFPVHLFPARDDAGADPWRGWQALLDDVSIRATPVPGTHLSMMEAPNVEFLGRALSRGIGLAAANRKVLP